MRLSVTRTFALVLLLALTGCGARASASGRQQRNLISQEEMRAAGYTDVLTTVQTLRPQWLNKRGVSSITIKESIKVYLDGSLLGGPESMQQITVRSISSIRYMDGLEATQRWGLDHGLGAILVFTRQQ